jgi:hypothetical protein
VGVTDDRHPVSGTPGQPVPQRFSAPSWQKRSPCTGRRTDHRCELVQRRRCTTAEAQKSAGFDADGVFRRDSEEARDYWPETPKPRRLSARGFALTTWTAFSAANCLAPRGGLEPPTKRLTAAYSTIELPGNPWPSTYRPGGRSVFRGTGCFVTRRAKYNRWGAGRQGHRRKVHRQQSIAGVSSLALAHWCCNAT